MKLSANFSLSEFTISQTASRLGINNEPTPDVLQNLIRTANCMEDVRVLLKNNSILISSGYRSKELNKAVKGSSSSQHVKGEACDFSCPNFGSIDEIMSVIVNSSIKYDQCIKEFNSWIHISFSDLNRRQALIIDSKGTRGYK